MLSQGQNLSSGILDLVNAARLVLEMPLLRRLPRGIPETARKCVLGRSLGLEILIDDQNRAYALLLRYRTACSLARVWGVVKPYGMWNGWAVLLPTRLNDFVHEFDSRCYPSMESSHRDSKAGIQSSARHLRFDWTDQHTRITDLLNRAKSACESARHTRDNCCDQGTGLLHSEHGSTTAQRVPKTHADRTDPHATVQIQLPDEQPAVLDLIKPAGEACNFAGQARTWAEERRNRVTSKPPSAAPAHVHSTSNT